jgi:hypothetical protein
MTTTFGDQLQTLVTRHGSLDVAQLAATWHARWQQAGHRGWSPAHVESSLARCVQGKPQGIRFFFEDPARGALLLEMLGASNAEQSELLANAASAIAAVVPNRLIVDLTPWADREDALALEAAERTFLTPNGIFPVVFVVTAEQQARLPATFTEHRDVVRIERVDNADTAWAVVQELAARAVLVASPRRHLLFERWLAIDFDGQSFVLDPENGLEEYAREGRLEPLPTPVHDVAELGVSGEPAAVPRSPVAVRKLLWALTHEGMAEGTIGQRLTLAERLGIRAASTESERIEAGFRAAGLRWQAATEAELRDVLGRAARRPVPPTVLLVGDLWHLINAEPPASLRSAPTRMQVHRIVNKTTALRRLLGGISGWTRDDWARDARLDRLVAALDRGEDQAALLHARAWLLLAGPPPEVPSAPVGDWEGALGPLIGGPPPAAQLRVEAVGSPPATSLSGGEDGPPAPFVAIGPDAGGWTRRMLDQIPVSRPQLLKRGEPLTGIAIEVPTGSGPRWLSLSKIGRAKDVTDEGAWFDNFERGSGPQWLSQGVMADRGLEILATDLTPPPELWLEADRQVALVRRALRQALSLGDIELLHDGRLIARVGNGLFAEMTLRVDLGGTEPAAALWFGLQRTYFPTGQFRAWTPGMLLGPGRGGTRITLYGGGFAGDVSFFESPLGG